MNSRLDEVQAAVLRLRLPRLAAANERRRAIAAAYDAALAGKPIIPPLRRPSATHVFHQYVVRTPQREEVQARLKQQGIATAIHYPQPVHLQPAYRGRVALGPAGCMETEAIAREILSLPMFPEMTEEQIAARLCGAGCAVAPHTRRAEDHGARQPSFLAAPSAPAMGGATSRKAKPVACRP